MRIQLGKLNLVILLTKTSQPAPSENDQIDRHVDTILSDIHKLPSSVTYERDMWGVWRATAWREYTGWDINYWCDGATKVEVAAGLRKILAKVRKQKL